MGLVFRVGPEGRPGTELGTRALGKGRRVTSISQGIQEFVCLPHRKG